jgi:hypothetical protein
MCPIDLAQLELLPVSNAQFTLASEPLNQVDELGRGTALAKVSEREPVRVRRSIGIY